eukprot:3935869-Rhodomonas_salina.1
MLWARMAVPVESAICLRLRCAMSGTDMAYVFLGAVASVGFHDVSQLGMCLPLSPLSLAAKSPIFATHNFWALYARLGRSGATVAIMDLKAHFREALLEDAAEYEQVPPMSALTDLMMMMTTTMMMMMMTTMMMMMMMMTTMMMIIVMMPNTSRYPLC